MQSRFCVFVLVAYSLAPGVFANISDRAYERETEETDLSKTIQVLVDTPEEFKAISKELFPLLEVSITSSPEKPKNHQSHTVIIRLDKATVKLIIHRNGNQILTSRQVDFPFKISNAQKNALESMSVNIYRFSLGKNKLDHGSRKNNQHRHIQLAANMVSIAVESALECIDLPP
jgi:hypothetical protein